MKTVFILLALLINKANICLAQYHYYKTYDTAQTANYLRSIVHYQDKYYCFGQLSEASGAAVSQCIFSIYAATNGEYLSSSIVKDSIDGYYNNVNSLVSNGSSFYACGSYHDVINTSAYKVSGLVFKYNLEGDTVWTKIIHDTDSLAERIFYSLIYYNNYIYCAGFRDSKINGIYKQNAIVVKLDTLGNIIWENRLPSAYKFNKAFSLVSHNNKMYVSGWQYDNINTVFSFSCNISENGIDTNHKQYTDTNFTAYIYKVFENGDYIITGQKTVGIDKYCGYIGKYNANGVLLWEKEVMKYNYWNFTINNDVFEDNQGNLTFFCTGYDPYETFYNTVSRYKFFIYKTASNGDSLWMKSYSRDDAHIYASDWVQNDDGGFTVCGSIQGTAIPGSWDAWLMRVDKDGCIDEFCTPVGIKEETPSPLGRDGVGLYPNPATDVVTIESNEAINKIEIINSQGQVMEIINCNNTTNYQLFTINYPNGIYFYRFSFSNNTTSNGKFLIQH